MTKSQWDDSASWYNQNMGEVGDKMNSELIRPAILAALGNLEGKSILDAGCGSGYFTVELADKAKKVIGTDFSIEFIKICKNKYKSQANLSFEQHDVTQPFSFKNESFDKIISKMVLQYVDQIKTFADESFRSLRDEGQLVVAVDHPFFTQFYYAQQLAGKKNPKYYDLKDYFSTGKRTKLSLWDKIELTWYQRKISDYINPFIESGLHLKHIKELSQEKARIRLPRILLLDFRK